VRFSTPDPASTDEAASSRQADVVDAESAQGQTSLRTVADGAGRLDVLTPIEQELQRRLLAFIPTQRRALFNLLASDDADRAEAVAAIWASGEADELSELLKDLQHDRFSRTLVLSALYEMDREPSSG
jgi:hypothetical protein